MVVSKSLALEVKIKLSLLLDFIEGVVAFVSLSDESSMESSISELSN